MSLMAVAQPNLKQGSLQASLWDTGSKKKTASGKKAGPGGVCVCVCVCVCGSVTVDVRAQYVCK